MQVTIQHVDGNGQFFVKPEAKLDVLRMQI
jgi:hypothetical protein